jgi:hypothetical protein
VATISNIFSKGLGSKNSHESFDDVQKTKVRNTSLLVALLAIPIITTSVPVLVCSSLLLVTLALFSPRVFPLNWKKIGIVAGVVVLGSSGVGIFAGLTLGLRILGPAVAIASVYFDLFTDDSTERNADRDYRLTLTASMTLSLTLAVYAMASLILKTQNFSRNETAYSLLQWSTVFFAGSSLASLAWGIHAAVFFPSRKK